MFTVTTLFADKSQGKIEHLSWDEVIMAVRVVNELSGVKLRRMDIVSEDV